MVLLGAKKVISKSFSHEVPRDFLQSQWQRSDKSLTFLIYRWIVAAFFEFCVVYSITANVICDKFSTYFIYLTYLNLCATMITMILGAILVTLHHFDNFEVEDKTPTSIKVYWALWNQSIVLSCIVSTMYWMVIYKHEPIDANNILVHAMNSIVLIIDLLICKHPPRYTNFILLVVVEMIYLLFTIVYQFAGGLDKDGNNFVYSISNWKINPVSASICFTFIMSLSIVLHFVINFIHSARKKFSEIVRKESSTVVNKNITVMMNIV